MDMLRLGSSFGRLARVKLMYKRKADCEKSKKGNYYRYDTCYSKDGKEIRPKYKNGGTKRKSMRHNKSMRNKKSRKVRRL